MEGLLTRKGELENSLASSPQRNDGRHYIITLSNHIVTSEYTAVVLKPFRHNLPEEPRRGSETGPSPRTIAPIPGDFQPSQFSVNRGWRALA